MTRDPSAATIYLGDSDGSPPHWGGAPRAARVIGRPRLPNGDRGWLVSVDPPLPRRGQPLDRAILMARYVGERLDRIGDGWIIVNVLGPAAGIDLHQPAYRDRELVVEFWAEAAETVEALPAPIDEARFWADTLARIRRFIDQHGHANVPDGYHDESGRLDILVENLRWHHAGKGGVSPGPFPGIDYAADLDRLPGWEW